MSKLLQFVIFFLSCLSLYGSEFGDQTFIRSISGTVSVIRNSSEQIQGKKGTRLEIGDTVLTGPGSNAIIVLAGTAIIKIRQETEFIIPKDKDNTMSKMSFIQLVKGFLWAKAKKDKNSLKIATPNAICGVRGTEFAVSEDNEQLKVMVSEGSVAFVPMFKGVPQKATLLGPGDALILDLAELLQELSEGLQEATGSLLDGLGNLDSKDGKLDINNLQDMGSFIQIFGNNANDFGKKAEENGNRFSQKMEANAEKLAGQLQKKFLTFAEHLVENISDTSSGLFKDVLQKSLSENGQVESFSSNSYGVSGFKKMKMKGSAQEITENVLDEGFNFDSFMEAGEDDPLDEIINDEESLENKYLKDRKNKKNKKNDYKKDVQKTLNKFKNMMNGF